jgi:hypothetical protein
MLTAETPTGFPKGILNGGSVVALSRRFKAGHSRRLEIGSGF